MSLNKRNLPAVRFGVEDSWLELDIAGYQFPEITTGWDANWLMIEGRAAIHGSEWAFVDPCLLAQEVLQLAKWLESVGNPGQLSLACFFTEPNMDFQLNTPGSIRINFSHECLPPWAAPREWGNYWIDLPITTGLLEAAHNLRRQLALYPQRWFNKGH